VSDGAFRWVVAAGVILAALAALGQLVVMLGLYRVGPRSSGQDRGSGRAGRVGARYGDHDAGRNKPKILAITENATALAARALSESMICSPIPRPV
jgi:hypothetical protein